VTEVVVATKNPDKIPEIEAMLGAVLPDLVIVRGLDWPEVEETGSTLEENALLKARTAAKATGYPAIGDDTGLEVDALDGAPGVHTARFAGPAASYAENRAALLRALAGIDDRSARFRTAAAFITPGGDEIVVTGELAGRIAREERGEGGFGYDSLFEVDGETLAEMGVGAKNLISHRARALTALAAALERVRDDRP
jgi:XTP/dITP diphosphohydrolase